MKILNATSNSFMITDYVKKKPLLEGNAGYNRRRNSRRQ
jgi:hypothetical protein